MDPMLTTPVEGQSAEAQPGGEQEWTAPRLKKLDLTETRINPGSADDQALGTSDPG